MQDPAQVVQGSSIHRLIFPQFVNGGTGDMMLVDQGIGCFLGIFQCFPERLIDDHALVPPFIADRINIYYSFILDYGQKNNYNVIKCI